MANDSSVQLVQFVGAVAALATATIGPWLLFRTKKVETEVTERNADFEQRRATFEDSQIYIDRIEKLADKFEKKLGECESKLGECVSVSGQLRQELQDAKWLIARLKQQVTSLGGTPINGS